MHYVNCPCCRERVEVPEAAIGEQRTDPWNVVVCELCDCGFDYDDEDVRIEPEPVAKITEVTKASRIQEKE